MWRVARVWIGVGLIYATILAWHQPLRGPLGEDEVRAAFGPRFDQMQASGDPQAAALLAFFLTDDGKPFFMVNLNALPDPTADTAGAARRHGTFMGARLLPRASYPVLSTNVIGALTNSLDADLGPFDRLVVVRYRSRRDFLAIIATPAFRDAVDDKALSLEGWYSAPAAIGPTVSLPLSAFALLLMIGVATTIRVQRSDRRRQDRLPFLGGRRA